jgi:S1-C subfamily serine protease
MNPFDTELSELEFASVDAPITVEAKAVERPHPVFFIVIATMCASLFLPWIILRIPGREVLEVSLFQMIGGTAMVFAFFFFVTCGILLWIARVRFGLALTAVAAAFIGWFAVLVSVTLGALRGMIPQGEVGTIDLGRGLVGIGPGAIIAIGALLLIAMETLPRGVNAESRNRRLLDGYGVVGFLLGLVLALTHTAIWVSGESSKYEAGLNLSGDSLFGSFLISVLVWTTAIVGVLTALRTTAKGGKVLGIMLVVTGLIKFFHALIFILGKGLVNFLLPSSVGNIVELDSHWPLWCTLIISLFAVFCGFVGFISEEARAKVSRAASFEYLPAIVLAVTAAVTVISNPNRENWIDKDTTKDKTTISSGGTTLPNGSAPLIDGTSAEGIARSVVLVATQNASGQQCWTGSGVAVLDGTYVLTNHHVVTPETKDDPSCNDLFVGITEDTSAEPIQYVPVKIVASDSSLDLALLKMETLPRVALNPVPIKNETLPLDSKIRIVGYPGVGGNTITVNEGIVSGIDKRDGTTFYKVSAQISPGNSGGPMVDSKGNLVGIATAYIPATVQCDNKDDCYAAGANLGLVRPISYAQTLLSQR